VFQDQRLDKGAKTSVKATISADAEVITGVMRIRKVSTASADIIRYQETESSGQAKTVRKAGSKGASTGPTRAGSRRSGDKGR
jgi:hypothetical protein